MAQRAGELRDEDTNQVIVRDLEIADSAWKRTVGLLGRTTMPSDSGLWLSPCNGIHTLAMRFPIDVLFLDAQGRAIRLAANVGPWRFRGPVLRAKAVVELPAGTLAARGVELGRHYRVAPARDR